MFTILERIKSVKGECDMMKKKNSPGMKIASIIHFILAVLIFLTGIPPITIFRDQISTGLIIYILTLTAFLAGLSVYVGIILWKGNRTARDILLYVYGIIASINIAGFLVNIGRERIVTIGIAVIFAVLFMLIYFDK